MRKVIALLIVLIVLTASMIFVHAKIWQIEDDVVFTEEILAGDVRWMEGETAEIRYNVGDYLRWYCEYTFGKTPSSHTSFRLLQKREPDLWERRNEFDINSLDGYGISDSFKVSDELPISYMLQAALDLTPAGESREHEFRTLDYIAYYPYSTYISYQSHTKLYNDFFDPAYDLGDESGLENLFDYGYNRAFSKQFRFPVSETDTTIVSVEKVPNSSNTICRVEHQSEFNYGFYTAVTDDGLYLIPYYEDRDGNQLPTESPDGRGLYFLPWKILSDVTFQTEIDGEPAEGNGVIPDIAHPQKLLSIPDEVPVRYFELSEDENTAWILTQEDGSFYLNVIEVPDGTVRNRIQLMDKARENGFVDSSIVTENGYMIVSACGKMALINLDGDCHLEFMVDSGAAEEHLTALNFPQELYLRYEGGVLTLLQQGVYQNNSFFAIVFTADGLQFLANYACNLDEQPAHSHHFAPSNYELPITLR